MNCTRTQTHSCRGEVGRGRKPFYPKCPPLTFIETKEVSQAAAQTQWCCLRERGGERERENKRGSQPTLLLAFLSQSLCSRKLLSRILSSYSSASLLTLPHTHKEHTLLLLFSQNLNTQIISLLMSLLTQVSWSSSRDPNPGKRPQQRGSR